MQNTTPEQLILDTLNKYRYVNRAAAELQMSRQWLHTLINRYGIQFDDATQKYVLDKPQPEHS